MSPLNPHTAARRQAETTYEPYAECLSKGTAGGPCPWDSKRGPNALVNAKHHATNRNHKVRVVWERVAVYGRDDYDHANDFTNDPS